MIQQVILNNDKETKDGKFLPLELSILSGDKTFILPTKLTQDSINSLFVIYQGLNLKGWKKFVSQVRDYKFEPVIEEMPEPSEEEGKIFDLSLESGGTVKFLVRSAIDSQVILGVH